MSDAQAWTLIAGFSTLMATIIGLTMRVVRAELGTLGGRLDAINVRFDGVDRSLTILIEASR